MIYKKIDISEVKFYLVSEECAKAVIDWRIKVKKGINQRIFDNALKKAQECTAFGLSQEEALDRWMESGWTGMKWVLEEAKRGFAEASGGSTRKASLDNDLHDRSWADKPVNDGMDNDKSWAEGELIEETNPGPIHKGR